MVSFWFHLASTRVWSLCPVGILLCRWGRMRDVDRLLEVRLLLMWSGRDQTRPQYLLWWPWYRIGILAAQQSNCSGILSWKFCWCLELRFGKFRRKGLWSNDGRELVGSLRHRLKRWIGTLSRCLYVWRVTGETGNWSFRARARVLSRKLPAGKVMRGGSIFQLKFRMWVWRICGIGWSAGISRCLWRCWSFVCRFDRSCTRSILLRNRGSFRWGIACICRIWVGLWEKGRNFSREGRPQKWLDLVCWLQFVFASLSLNLSLDDCNPSLPKGFIIEKVRVLEVW